MQYKTQPFLANIAAGVFGGTIFGLYLFMKMVRYGSIHGCWGFVDSIFETAGYESCGAFGTIIGVILGSIIGVIISIKINIKRNYIRFAGWLLLSTIILPFTYGTMMFWPLSNENALLLFAVTLLFVFFSLVSSFAVISMAFVLRRFDRRRTKA